RIERYSHFRLTYQGTGLFFILIAYFYFSLVSPYEKILGEITTTNWIIQLLFVLFGIASLISVASGIVMYERFKPVKHEFFLILIAFLGWVVLWILTFFKEAMMVTITRYGYTYTTLDPRVATILLIVYNLMFFAIAIGSILIGYYKSTVPFINIGMLFFVVGILHLYYTTLYKLLPKSLAFITGGLILLGLGWYLEKKRRSLISDIRGS
ncbi:MAG: hypothetical protein QMD22_05450, partial [archaeon]|nr:hypothetical protein [archaeon]